MLHLWVEIPVPVSYTHLDVYKRQELSKLDCNKLNYVCVGESNHDGDFGYAANVALEAAFYN